MICNVLSILNTKQMSNSNVLVSGHEQILTELKSSSPVILTIDTSTIILGIELGHRQTSHEPDVRIMCTVSLLAYPGQSGDNRLVFSGFFSFLGYRNYSIKKIVQIFSSTLVENPGRILVEIVCTLILL